VAQEALLRGSVIAGAAALWSGAASAQTPITVTLSGFTTFAIEAGSGGALDIASGRDFGFFMDNEIAIEAVVETKTGLIIGSNVELDVSFADEALVDEAVLFFSGGFGRLELGQDDGAEAVMFVGAYLAQAGTGGIDGYAANLPSIAVQSSDDATKATYFTPRTAGLQLGGSFTPEHDGFASSIGLGANWLGAVRDVDLNLAAVAIFARSEDDEEEGLADWAIGSLIGIANLHFGASFVQRTRAGRADIANLGLRYDFGEVSASAGYAYDDSPDDGRQDVFVLAGHVQLLEGLFLSADVSYNTNDPAADPAGRPTWAGVLAVELYY
jgi:outer membrane protein OmpU